MSIKTNKINNKKKFHAKEYERYDYNKLIALDLDAIITVKSVSRFEETDKNIR